MTFLVLMPYILRRLGVKRMFLLGILAWTIRFGLFGHYAAPPGWGLTTRGASSTGSATTLFVMGRIHVNRRAPEHLRTTAQGLLTFVKLGAAISMGTWLSGSSPERVSHI